MEGKSTVGVRCPSCHNQVGWIGDVERECSSCGFKIGCILGVPVLWSADREAPFDLTHEANTLPQMNSLTMGIPFVHDAIKSGKLALELGAGIDNCDAENLVKTDAFVYSSNLDIVADAHNLPFLDEQFDFVYSTAVFEHLHSPWIAAEEIYRVLKPGGRVYTLTAFNQHVHGYPSHYFNMTDMGVRRIFEKFTDVHVEPSPFCPLDQISYSLLDLMEMNRALQTEQPSDGENLKLDQSILGVVESLGVLGPRLINSTAAVPHWAKIAPGFDCYASKP